MTAAQRLLGCRRSIGCLSQGATFMVKSHLLSTQRALLDWLRVECCGKEERRRKNSEGKGGGHFYSAVQRGRAGSEELGEESPGWPIKCLAVPRKRLPASRWRFISLRQPACKAVGAMRYSRFVTCYPWPVRVPCFNRSWTIWKHKEPRPRPRPRPIP